MSVMCQCPSCKAKYQVGDQYAGRTIKCPKCSAAVAVPTLAQPARPVAETATSRRSSLGPICRGARQGATVKPSSAAGASKAAPSGSSKVELPTARAVNRVENSPAKPAPVAASAMKIVKAVPLQPADAATDDQDTDEELPADDGLGFLADEPAVSPGRTGPQRRAEPMPRRAPPDEGKSSDDAQSSDEQQSSDEDGPAGNLAAIVRLAARPPKGVAPHASRRKKRAFPPG